MIKDFGLKIFNGSQNFYARCSLGAAQKSTVSRNFAATKARLAAQNLSLAPSRHTQIKSGPARSCRCALDGLECVRAPCHVAVPRADKICFRRAAASSMDQAYRAAVQSTDQTRSRG